MIPCYDTDVNCFLKPSSFMDLAQEAANLHADVLGFGYDDLIRTRTAWVLSRMHIKFVRHPKWRDEVNLSTWHKGPCRLFYLRDFRMTDKDGKDMVVATTSWLVLNIDTRRLTRDAVIAENSDSVCRENAIEEPCDKVQIPAGANEIFAGVHVVSYSDVDMNGHTNNAVYLVWAMNVVDFEVASAGPVKEARINFNHETKPGEKVSLYKIAEKMSDGWIYYVEGRLEDGTEKGKSAFCVEIKL